MVSIKTYVVLPTLDSGVGDGDQGTAGERGKGESSKVICGWSDSHGRPY